MNAAQSQTEFLLSRMAATRPVLEAAEAAAARRTRVVRALFDRHVRILERRSTVLRWQRRASWLAVAAMPVLAVIGGWYFRALAMPAIALEQASALPLRLEVAAGTVRVKHGGRSDSVAAPGMLGLESCEDLLTPDDGRASVVLESGTRVEARSSTRFGIHVIASERKTAETVDLREGQVAVSAPKLPRDRFLSVRTPDATVEVRGTQFTVEIEDTLPTTITRVVVTEGRVLVRHGAQQRFLSAGESWSSPRLPHTSWAESLPDDVQWLTGEPAMTRSMRGRGSAQPDSERAPESSTAASRGAQEPSTATSATAENPDLGLQVRLFKRAMQARRESDDGRALALFEQLLLDSPDTPLAQEARVERFRTLKRMGQHDVAAREARRYLADFPGGFATKEARALALDRAGEPSGTPEPQQ